MNRERRGPSRVVYIIVDGMSSTAFEQVTASGRAPALQFLKDHSSYVRDSIAVWPTITPAATSSLVTGASPAQHRVPGMCWYDRAQQRFVNFGQSPRVAVIEGASQIVEDILVNLNEHYLSRDVRTLHERLDERGIITASVNFMVFRGPYRHELKPNLIERLFFKKQLPDQLYGPKEHYFADVITGHSEACSKLLSARGLDKRIRITDGWAACVTRELLERNTAEMILFYLHENDHASHRNGPASQIDSLAEADKHVAHVLDAFDSWEQAIEEVGFVVTADHSQSPVVNDDDHVFQLEDVLDDFHLVDPSRGKEPLEGDGCDLASAGNGRLAFIYLNSERKSFLHSSVTKALEACAGIDQVIFKDEDAYLVHSDRGTLRFWKARGARGVVDEREEQWRYDGELAAVSGVVEGDRIRTPEYPLAMWRIASALDLDRTGDIVVTTKLGYEMKDIAGGDHKGGGDHGSLHAQDSIVPFLSTLADPPLRPSTVDVAPHILRHFERLRE
jgi:predicted AlkP superfamily pyrophosphatase or phosphodiesterase